MTRRVALLCASVLVAAGLAVAPPLSGVASAAELLGDGGFESASGNPVNSPSWSESDTWRGSPLCDTSLCQQAMQVGPPRSGSKWALFGGTDDKKHQASLAQSVVIPTGSATLSYWYRNGAVSAPYDAVLQVRVDGTTVRTHTEAGSPQSAYTQQSIDVSAYANGRSHTISFVYANQSTGLNVMTVDDVSLNHTPPMPTTARPTVSSTVPASPGSTTTPKVKGTAEAGSTVVLYANSSCTGTPLGTGTAADFAGAGVTATVPAGATTTIWAKATKSGQNDSPCSTTSVSYTHDGTPPALVVLTGTTPASPNADTTPLVKGTAETGSTVTLYTNSTCTSAVAATGPAATFTATGLEVTVAAGSTTTFWATATDAAGNRSACSTSSVTYVQDATPPGPVQVVSVTPASPSPNTQPTVKGTAEANSQVRLYTTATCTGTPVATGTAAQFGNPGFTVTVPANSTTTFRATAVDPAGNVSACSSSSVTYTNDSLAPPPVVLDAVTPTTPNPSTTPSVRGTAETGATVQLFTTAGCTGSPVATGTAAQFAAAGFSTTVVLGSTTTFRARATDAAGNTSACSTSTATYTADLLDGGFEAATGDPADSPGWAEADTLAGSPLCTFDTCTEPGGETAPRTGRGVVWFGGFEAAGHTGSVSQQVVLPATGQASLTFWYKNTTVSAPYDARLFVEVDGTVLRTIVEATADDTAYSQQVVGLSAYADGGSHTITFSYVNGGQGVTNMLVDDVTLGVAPAARAAAPTLTGVTPSSTSTTPRVTGSAENGATVDLYGNAACTGRRLGSGSAADLAGAGIAASVPAGSTTTFYARTITRGKDDSACSTTSVTYRHLAPPETTFTKTPGAKVGTRKKKAKVAFAFTSSTAGATFECSLDGKAYAACVSGRTWKLKPGKHTFAVRAVAAGLTDATPAVWTLKVKRKRS